MKTLDLIDRIHVCDLPPLHRWLLATIAVHSSGDEGFCSCSIPTLARETGMDVKTVRSYLRLYVTWKILTAQVRRGETTRFRFVPLPAEGPLPWVVGVTPPAGGRGTPPVDGRGEGATPPVDGRGGESHTPPVGGRGPLPSVVGDPYQTPTAGGTRSTRSGSQIRSRSLEDQDTEPDHAPERPYRVVGVVAPPPDEPTEQELAELLGLQAGDGWSTVALRPKDRSAIERFLARGYKPAQLAATWQRVMDDDFWKDRPEIRCWAVLLNDKQGEARVRETIAEAPADGPVDKPQLSPPGTPEHLWTDEDWIHRTGAPKPVPGENRRRRRALPLAAR